VTGGERWAGSGGNSATSPSWSPLPLGYLVGSKQTIAIAGAEHTDDQFGFVVCALRDGRLRRVVDKAFSLADHRPSVRTAPD
jgi:hypothetical protein